MHIQLKPGLCTVWRGAGSVQIGISTRRGTVLEGLTAADARLVEDLRSGIDTSALDHTGPAAASARRHELIRLLDEAGVLLTFGPEQPRADAVPHADRLQPDAALWSIVYDDAGDGWGLLAARARRRVLICGTGRLGGALAAQLAAAGVGQLSLADGARITAADLAPAAAQPADLGRARHDAAADAVLRAGGRAWTPDALTGRGSDTIAAAMTGPATHERPDLVVLVEYAVADAAAADPLVAADVPHLSVVIGEDDVVVGPLVRPGNGPCLRCLDLHRCDRDPAWPSILAQVLGRAPDRRTQAAGGEETAISALAAGLAAAQVLTQLDGLREPATAGATLEIEPPDGLIARRIWPPHRACGCHWPPRIGDARRAAAGPGGQAGAGGERIAE